MARLEDWEPEWVCKCGAHYRGAPDGLSMALFSSDPMSTSRFLAFGFDQCCKKCGENLGDDGAFNQVRCEIVRYRRERTLPWRWWNPSTWGAWKLVREVKG